VVAVNMKSIRGPGGGSETSSSSSTIGRSRQGKPTSTSGFDIYMTDASTIIPGVHPRNEFSLALRPVEAVSSPIPVVCWRMDIKHASQARRLLSTLGVDSQEDETSIRPSNSRIRELAIYFSGTAYPDVERDVLASMYFSKPDSRMTLLPSEIAQILHRIDDDTLFATFTSQQLEQRWNALPEMNWLYPHQRRGVEFAWARRNRATIADSMGLGKTIQALVVMLSAWYLDGNYHPLLIVVSNVANVPSWKSDCSKVFPGFDPDPQSDSHANYLSDGAAAVKCLSKLATLVETRQARTAWQYEHYSSSPPPSSASASSSTSSRNKRKRKRIDDGLVPVYIITYSLLRTSRVLDLLKRCKFQKVIFDESQALRNPLSQQSQACLQLVSHSKYKYGILLSGTPAINPKEWYMSLKLLHPWMFPTFWTPYWTDQQLALRRRQGKRLQQSEVQAYVPPNYRINGASFAWRYCDPHYHEHDIRTGRGKFTKTIREWSFNGCSRLLEFGAILTHYVLLRRTPRDVPEFKNPDMPRFVIPLSMSESIRQRHVAAITQLAVLKRNNIEQWRTALMALYYKHLVDHKLPSLLEYLKRLFVDRRYRQKCVIFAKHTALLQAIDRALSNWRIPHFTMDGSATKVARVANISNFRTESASTCQVAVMSFAFNAGINMEEGWDVLFAEFPMTPSEALQAEARINRLTTIHPVRAYYFTLRESLEELYLLPNLQRKELQSEMMLSPHYLIDPSSTKLSGIHFTSTMSVTDWEPYNRDPRIHSTSTTIVDDQLPLTDGPSADGPSAIRRSTARATPASRLTGARSTTSHPQQNDNQNDDQQDDSDNVSSTIGR
jgi:SNF2-related domain